MIANGALSRDHHAVARISGLSELGDPSEVSGALHQVLDRQHVAQVVARCLGPLLDNGRLP